MYHIIGERGAWRARFCLKPLTLAAEAGQVKVDEGGRLPNMHVLSMANRLCVQPARGYTEGVLAYVVYEGRWCREHKVCDFAEP